MCALSLPADLSTPALELAEAAVQLGGTAILFGVDDTVIWANDTHRTLFPYINYDSGSETYTSLSLKIIGHRETGSKFALENPNEWVSATVAARHSSRNLDFVNTDYPWGAMAGSHLLLDDGRSIQTRVRLANLPASLGAKTSSAMTLALSLYREQASLRAALDSVDVGVGVVRADGTLEFANGSLRDLLESGDGLSLGDRGQVKAHDGLDHDRLVEALALAVGPAMASDILPLRRPAGRAPHIAAISPATGVKAAVIAVARFGEDLQGIADAVGRAFHMTPAEAQVATLLGSGRSVKEIAEIRETSEGTIRNQVKAIRGALSRLSSAAGRLPGVTAMVGRVSAVTRARARTHKE